MEAKLADGWFMSCRRQKMVVMVNWKTKERKNEDGLEELQLNLTMEKKSVEPYQHRWLQYKALLLWKHVSVKQKAIRGQKSMRNPFQQRNTLQASFKNIHDTRQTLCIHCKTHKELCSLPSTSLKSFKTRLKIWTLLIGIRF